MFSNRNQATYFYLLYPTLCINFCIRIWGVSYCCKYTNGLQIWNQFSASAVQFLTVIIFLVSFCNSPSNVWLRFGIRPKQFLRFVSFSGCIRFWKRLESLRFPQRGRQRERHNSFLFLNSKNLTAKIYHKQLTGQFMR